MLMKLENKKELTRARLGLYPTRPDSFYGQTKLKHSSLLRRVTDVKKAIYKLLLIDGREKLRSI